MYERVNLVLRKDSNISKDAVASAAEREGQSLNAYIVQAIRERMQRDADQADQADNSTPPEA